MLTIELISKALPPHLKNHATQKLVDMVNNAVNDPVIAENIRDNFISYTKVLQEGKYRIEDYLNAVKFVSFRLMGDSNQEAYFKTFPQRYQALLAKGTTSKDIAAYVSAYTRGQLVNRVMEQSLVPSWVLNQHMYQEALNVQFNLMHDSGVSPKVRSDAANSLLTHLAKPKEAGPLVNIDMRETSGLTELKEAMAKMAAQQQDLIRAGMSPKAVAAQTIIGAEK